MPLSAAQKKENLLAAEEKAKQLFLEIEERGWIEAGISEVDLSDKIFDLAFEMFQTKKHLHKRGSRQEGSR